MPVYISYTLLCACLFAVFCMFAWILISDTLEDKKMEQEEMEMRRKAAQCN